MRCKACDYPLWNLKTRQCPECGLPFRPDEFEFRPNAVRFCCPHCNQAYYGTDANGHLQPTAFYCVTCGRHVVMNEMVLLPAEGLVEQQTKAAVNPWLERHRDGWFKSWFRTIGQSLVSPGQLMKGTTVESPVKQAWWFFTATLIAVMVASLIPAAMFMVWVPFAASPGTGGPGPGAMAALMGASVASMFVIAIPFMMGYVAVWGLVTHGVLKIGSARPRTIRRTYQALCYSFGAYVTSVVPCLGGYAAPIWWIVSAILMIREGHRVSGLRATLSVLAFPVCSIVGLVALYVAVIVAAVAAAASQAATGGVAWSTQSTKFVADAIRDYAAGHDGRGPGHALQLIETTSLTEWSFVDSSTATAPADVAVAGAGTLLDFAALPPDEQRDVADDAAAALPADVVAHRVGDFVFTYHGMDLKTAWRGLWVVVMAPDPAVNPADGPIIVGTVDGSVQAVPAARLIPELARQNTLRSRDGLPPLPDPRQVTDDAPATGGP